MILRTFVLFTILISGSALATSGYYRFPDIHKETIVFTAEGDLWVATVDEPQARRLTTHTTQEVQGTISPDGTKVAYIANYEGSSDVYVIAINGGIAKRVSFETGSAMVHGWTPDGGVIYSTNSRLGPPRNWSLQVVYPDSLQTKPIEVADAREGVMDAKGEWVYFSQFGVANYSDNVRKYRGGALGEIWRYKVGSSDEAQKLTANHEGNARQPMVYKNTLYFISDADGVDNIWKMDVDGSDIEQVTRYSQFPVRSGRLHQGKMVYQLGADIKMMTLRRGKSKVLPITLTSDLPNLRERWVNEPLKFMTSATFSGEQEKVTLTARGRVAVAGTDKSRLVEIATPFDSRSREAVLSPDGKWVYVINDASGEQEIWRYAADGSGDFKQLTTDGVAYRWNLKLSPDGNYIAHSDKNGDLWLLSLEDLTNKKIFSQVDGFSPVSDLRFSADSRFLTVAIQPEGDTRSRIALYSIEDGKQKFLTSDKFASYSPVFSPDGKWLYFLSERNFAPTPGSPWGDRNMGPMFDRKSMIFAYSLDAKARFPFAPANELMPKEKKRFGKKDKDEVMTIDFDGIESRLWQVNVPAGNYWNLSVNNKFLYVQDRKSEPGALNELKSIKIEPETKVETFSFGVNGYEMSSDGKKLFIQKGRRAGSRLYIVDAKAKMAKDLSQSTVQTKDWNMLIEPAQEWQQMLHDAWLQHRDTLYDRNLRGVNWANVEKKYQPLVKRLTDKWELNDLLAQMVGEVNTLHSQIRPGDVPVPANRAVQANLGAQLVQHKDGVKIEQIYLHDKELPWRAPPLSKAGVDAKNGDIIVAVNGRPITDIAQLVSALRNKVGKQVLLELKREEQTHKTVVVPASAGEDARQRHKHWVVDNRNKVEGANEAFGYLHLWTMGSRDLGSFAEDFYANIDKKGLIIDVRRNRGGNIDSIIIEKLLRKAWSYWQSSKSNITTNMQSAFRGHLVVLADQGTYSDGETFTAAFKALDLGPVIGKRTTGAGVFLRDMNSLSDFGMARAAELPQFSPDGRWIIEGHGVAPTIEVDNLPHVTYKGGDAQLERAIAYLQQKLKASPIKPLESKPYPANGVPAQDIK